MKMYILAILSVFCLSSIIVAGDDADAPPPPPPPHHRKSHGFGAKLRGAFHSKAFSTIAKVGKTAASFTPAGGAIRAAETAAKLAAAAKKAKAMHAQASAAEAKARSLRDASNDATDLHHLALQNHLESSQSVDDGSANNNGYDDDGSANSGSNDDGSTDGNYAEQEEPQENGNDDEQ